MNNKVLSIVLVVIVGLGIISGAFWFLRGKSSTPETGNQKGKEEEVTTKELPIGERPYASLTPRADGKELHLVVTKLPTDAKSMEYELVYQVESGITQGVPGNVKDLAGKTTIERDLLLGTCSSGKCRYDEGVEEGTFTLRFRNDKGKLVYKYETGFHLQQNPTKISSNDEKFTISGTFPKGYYLTMGTFGLPEKAPGEVAVGPYGVFTKTVVPRTFKGVVSMDGDVYVYSNQAGDWMNLEDKKTSLLDTFIATK